MFFNTKISNLVFIFTLCFYVINVDKVNAAEFKLDKTAEDIPKKALIIKHGAKLFKSSDWWNNTAEEAPFMELYFLMTPEIKSRVPILKKFSKTKTQPEGWLEKDSYVEWNTVQMLNFEPQKGRELVKIYDTKECARKFGVGEAVVGCQLVGEEPRKNQRSRLFIPVFELQQGNYHGGFIRVYQDNLQHNSTQLGYDLILVVDSTRSMRTYFEPTMRVLQSFLKIIQNSMQGEITIPLHIGLIFYRDRKQQQDCDIEYLTQWAQPLTPNTSTVLQALKDAKVTLCDTEDEPEAVFDGIHRAIVDTQWNNNHYKTILLIGDAPPNFDENPLNFSVTSLIEEADKKDIRFLTFKIGPKNDQNIKEFRELALTRTPQQKGRFSRVDRITTKANKADIQQFEGNLLNALTGEWNMFKKTLDVLSQYRKNPVSQNLSQLTEYELPIIIGRLEKIGLSPNSKDFVKGWVPRKVKNKLAFGEYIFMEKFDLKLRVLIIENIIMAATAGRREGAGAFLDTLRQTLAGQLGMKPGDIFTGDERLGDILWKTKLLPFKTELLLFTPAEINTWKPDYYETLNQLLTEKLRYLREFFDDPNNLRSFDGVHYLYVPKQFFP